MPDSTDEYVNKLKVSLRRARDLEIVDEEIPASQSKQERNYCITNKMPFKPGDLVWLHNPALRRITVSKPHSPYEGPYKVLKKSVRLRKWEEV